jgi:hypothetical protein
MVPVKKILTVKASNLKKIPELGLVAHTASLAFLPGVGLRLRSSCIARMTGTSRHAQFIY